MGLEKEKVTKYGVEGEYWRIIKLASDYIEGKVSCTIALYVTYAARLAESDYIEHRHFALNNSYMGKEYENGDDTMRNITLKEAYVILKEMAIVEHNKTEGSRNAELAWFWDADDKIE